MNIAVISDTHIPQKAKQLPQRVKEVLQHVDLILHIGDWQTLDVYHQLRTYAPVEGVIGNVDDKDICHQFPNNQVIQFSNTTIGITHGHGKRKTTEKRALDTFAYEDVDIIIYGHSHIPVLKQVDDILLFNPGSPTDKRRQKQYSFGLIEIKDEIVEVEHIFFDEKH